MARTPFYLLPIGLLVLLWALPARASIVTFGDSTFVPSDWSLVTQTIGPGGTANAVQQPSEGNTGPYRQVTVNVTGGTDSEVYAFNLKNNAVYDPTTGGGIISLTYSEDRNTSGQEFGPAIQQGTRYYYAFGGAGPSTGWQSTTITYTPGASVNDLLTSFRTDSSSSAHPDFSATALPITFGFAAINNSNSQAFTAISGYDNWTIAITTANSIPEPAATGVWLVISIRLLFRRHLLPSIFKAAR